MSTKRRDRTVLGVFSLLVLSYGAFAIHGQMSNGDSESSPAGDVRADRMIGDADEERDRPVDLSGTILARNVFEPLVMAVPEPGSGSGGRSGGYASDEPGFGPAEPHSRDGWAAAGGGDGEGEGDDGEGSGKGEPIDIALVGVVSGADGPQALIENEEHESAYVSMNEETYGYTLVATTPNGAVFQQEDRYYVLKVGDGKKTPTSSESKSSGDDDKSSDGDDKAGGSSGRSSGGRSSSSYGGSSGGRPRMSPEMIESYRAKYGGSSRGGYSGRGRSGGPPHGPMGGGGSMRGR